MEGLALLGTRRKHVNARSVQHLMGSGRVYWRLVAALALGAATAASAAGTEIKVWAVAGEPGF